MKVNIYPSVSSLTPIKANSYAYLFSIVTIDFITKLLELEDKVIGQVYDIILVIVDRLTKYIYFILITEKYTIE